MKNVLFCGVVVFFLAACDNTTSSVVIPAPLGFSNERKSDSSIIATNSSSSEVDGSPAVPKLSSSSVEDSSEYDPETGTLKDLRDGQIYKTVVFGEGENVQIWMAENLNYAYSVPTAKFDSSSFCYDNDPQNCEIYGRIYLWSAAMDSAAVFSDAGKGCGGTAGVDSSVQNCNISGVFRSVCPKGWHLPTSDEWYKLLQTINDLTSDDKPGKYLKSSSGWKLKDGEDYNGEDTYGFTILPVGNSHVGYLGRGGLVSERQGEICFFWSADKYDAGSPGAQGFYNESHQSYSVGSMPVGTLPIRCLMD